MIFQISMQGPLEADCDRIPTRSSQKDLYETLREICWSWDKNPLRASHKNFQTSTCKHCKPWDTQAPQNLGLGPRFCATLRGKMPRPKNDPRLCEPAQSKYTWHLLRVINARIYRKNASVQDQNKLGPETSCKPAQSKYTWRSQGQFDARIYRKNGGDQRANPDLTPALTPTQFCFPSSCTLAGYCILLQWTLLATETNQSIASNAGASSSEHCPLSRLQE